MKDIHAHIIYEVDDGAKNFDEAISILREAELNGVTDIVLTPHFIKKQYDNVKLIEKRFNELKKYTHIKLYLGNEVTLYDDLPKDLKKNKVYSINNTKYVLIELYKFSIFPNLLNLIHELKIAGYTPILAHPERYDTYNNISFFQELIDNGCLLQGNYASLFGYYGKDAKKLLRKLIKKKMIYILASDIHRISDNKYKMVKKIPKKLRFIASKSYIKDMLDNNFDLIVNSCTKDDN